MLPVHINIIVFAGTQMHDYENQEYLRHLIEKPPHWYADVLARVCALKPKRVLELGCGDGAFSRLLAKERIRVLALDHSKTFLEYARKHTKSRLVRFERANLDSAVGLSVSERKFDAVVSIDVIEHIKRKERLLKDAASVLGDGKTKVGYLILQVPNLYCNVISRNYVHSPKNICKKFFRAVRGTFSRKPPEDITKVEYGLDYRTADHDAVWLSSPFWFFDFFKRHNWKVISFTSFSLESKSKTIKAIVRFFGYFPLIRYMGGRMIFVVQYQGPPAGEKKRKQKE
jgi:ubiquinone/menaquinone biosynthesis C-methylase UbiE